jgi:hypothetical protein
MANQAQRIIERARRLPGIRMWSPSSDSRMGHRGGISQIENFYVCGAESRRGKNSEIAIRHIGIERAADARARASVVQA